MDPTHVNFITEKTMVYFAQVPAKLKNNIIEDSYAFLRELSTSYGIKTKFKLESSKMNGFHVEQVMVKLEDDIRVDLSQQLS